MTDYSVKDVARLFGVEEARLRYWAQTGFVGPSIRRGNRFFYSFEDLIGVKAAKELLDSGLSLRSVRKNLEALRATLPQVERPLSRLRIASDGERIVVVTDHAAFEPATGQLVMSFAVQQLEARVAEVLAFPRPGPAPNGPTTAYAVFLEGARAEQGGDWTGAETLFRRALELDPNLAAAWTNLGNLCERRSRRGEARESYERALELDPDQPEARFNLANLLSDIGETERAIGEYRRVIALCPEFADAHYNLGLLLLRTGHSATEVRKHLERYLDLDSASDWAAMARQIIDAM